MSVDGRWGEGRIRLGGYGTMTDPELGRLVVARDEAHTREVGALELALVAVIEEVGEDTVECEVDHVDTAPEAGERPPVLPDGTAGIAYVKIVDTASQKCGGLEDMTLVRRLVHTEKPRPLRGGKNLVVHLVQRETAELAMERCKDSLLGIDQLIARALAELAVSVLAAAAVDKFGIWRREPGLDTALTKNVLIGSPSSDVKIGCGISGSNIGLHSTCELCRLDNNAWAM